MAKTGQNKKLVLLVVLGLVVPLALTWVIVQKVSQNSDRQRFAEASKEKSLVVDSLVDYLGDNVMSDQEKNECFNTEQGPYDNGRLWCQATTVVKLKSDVSFEELGSRFVKGAESEGLKVTSSNNHGVLRIWFDTDKHMSCELSASSLTGDEFGGATSDPLSDVDAPAFAVSCADRAKAKHYPYVED